MIFVVTFICSTNDFYIQQIYVQQEIYIFSNLKFVLSNVRFIFNNLRFAFNEMKFIKSKSFTFSKPNWMEQNKQPRAFVRTKDFFCCKSSLWVFSRTFWAFFVTTMMFKGKVFFLLLSYWSMNSCKESEFGWEPDQMHVDVHKFFAWI